jgi:hypothetical protein
MATLPSGLSDSIDPSERLARFLRSGSHVAKSLARVKAAAFLPAPDNDTSVFRVDGIQDTEVTALGAEHVPQSSKHGAAVLEAEWVSDEDLLVEAKEPPFRHANIRGWATLEDKVAQKLKRKSVAAILAERSQWVAPASSTS